MVEVASRADVLEGYKKLKDSIQMAPELTRGEQPLLVAAGFQTPEEFLGAANKFQSKKLEEVRIELVNNA